MARDTANVPLRRTLGRLLSSPLRMIVKSEFRTVCYSSDPVTITTTSGNQENVAGFHGEWRRRSTQRSLVSRACFIRRLPAARALANFKQARFPSRSW